VTHDSPSHERGHEQDESDEVTRHRALETRCEAKPCNYQKPAVKPRAEGLAFGSFSTCWLELGAASLAPAWLRCRMRAAALSRANDQASQVGLLWWCGGAPLLRSSWCRPGGIVNAPPPRIDCHHVIGMQEAGQPARSLPMTLLARYLVHDFSWLAVSGMRQDRT